MHAFVASGNGPKSSQSVTSSIHPSILLKETFSKHYVLRIEEQQKETWPCSHGGYSPVVATGINPRAQKGCPYVARSPAKGKQEGAS